jgi:hypothetical protein
MTNKSRPATKADALTGRNKHATLVIVIKTESPVFALLRRNYAAAIEASQKLQTKSLLRMEGRHES